MPRLRRFAPTAPAECPWNGWPNAGGIAGRMLVEQVAGWRGMRNLGSDQWYRWQKQLLEQPGPDPGEVVPDFDGMLAVQRFLFAARPVRPTEPGMAEAVRALQDLGFPVLALIARDPQAIGATRRELSRNGFDLTRTAPVAPAALAEAAIPDPHAPDPGAHQKAPPLRR